MENAKKISWLWIILIPIISLITGGIFTLIFLVFFPSYLAGLRWLPESFLVIIGGLIIGFIPFLMLVIYATKLILKKFPKWSIFLTIPLTIPIIYTPHVFWYLLHMSWYLLSELGSFVGYLIIHSPAIIHLIALIITYKKKAK